MRMDEIGYHHRHDATFCVDRPNGAGDWLFLVIHSPAVFRIDGVECTASAQSYILYTPDYPEYYRADHCEYMDDWIHFGPDAEEEHLIRTLKIPLNQVVSLGDTSSISNLVKTMCFEFYSAHLHRQEIVDLNFRILLYKLHERVEIKNPSSGFSESVYGERLMWIRECIYRKPSNAWSIDTFANDLALSRSRFQHLYTETFGVSVKQDIIQSRIQFACYLLKEKDWSIDDIASTCGYSTTAYFIRQFKEVTAQSPAQYRLNQSEKP